jgi:hypothetical protein
VCPTTKSQASFIGDTNHTAMGKHKKPKTQHLGDAEIWDDSALISSWDEAVAEYEVSQIY